MPKAQQAVLVTGASGFIGRRLINRLLAEEHEVRAFVRPRAGKSRFPDGVAVRKGDVRFADTIREPVQGCSTVYHLAARMGGVDLEDYREVNVYGSASVAKAAMSAGARMIFVSTVSAMGPRKGHPDRGRSEGDTGPAPTDPYGASKREAEERLLELARKGDLELDIIRPGIVYGPGGGGWFPDLIHDIAAGRIHRMGPGTNRLGLVYVDHLVDALVALLDQPPDPTPMIAVDPAPPTLDELLEALARLVGRPLPRRRWPAAEAKIRGMAFMVLAKRSGTPTSLTRSRIALLLSDQWFEGGRLRERIGPLSMLPFDERLRRTMDHALAGEA